MADTSMTAKIEDGRLIVSIPLYPEPQRSASGKTRVVASSRGNQPTAAVVDGQPVIVGLNAYIR